MSKTLMKKDLNSQKQHLLILINLLVKLLKDKILLIRQKLILKIIFIICKM